MSKNAYFNYSQPARDRNSVLAYDDFRNCKFEDS